MSVHEVQPYKDAEGQHRWRVVVKGIKGSAVEDNIVADSGQGYNNEEDMAKSFFGLLFGDWNDSFLTFYNKWAPDDNKLTPPLAQPSPENDIANGTSITKDSAAMPWDGYDDPAVTHD